MEHAGLYKPVVLIDYLQILAPYSDKLTDKQSVDKNILELKRLSRDYKIPIIIIKNSDIILFTTTEKSILSPLLISLLFILFKIIKRLI